MLIPTYYECPCCRAGQLARIIPKQGLATMDFAVQVSHCFNCGYAIRPFFQTIVIPVKHRDPGPVPVIGGSSR